jgi:predicted peptidase
VGVFGKSVLPLATIALTLAQGRVDGFIARSYESAAGLVMPYRLFIPDRYDQKTKYPLVVWLHGSGGVGSDNLRQISADQIAGTHVWTKPENQAEHPSFVLAPQSAKGWLTNGPNKLSPPTLTVVELVGVLQNEFNIDPQRIYVAGQSNGGLGVWALLQGKPNMFAAAILVSAGVFRESVSSIPRTPLWAFEGDKDDTRLVAGLREMITNIKNAGGNPRYTEYKGVGHEIGERPFQEPELIVWLFRQHK